MCPPGARLCGTVPGTSLVLAMILVAIGANLSTPDGRTPYQLCHDAVDALARLPGLPDCPEFAGLVVTAVSSWYRSAPVPRSDQPDYVNGVVRLDVVAPTMTRPTNAEPDPATLLAALARIERTHGRARGVVNAARTLDLDIIAMGSGGGLLRDRPDPVLPHPRAHQRAFVLLPLREVAPYWLHPRLGLTVEQLIRQLPSAELEPDAIGICDSPA